jgi:hypothetical protein
LNGDFREELLALVKGEGFLGVDDLVKFYKDHAELQSSWSSDKREEKLEKVAMKILGGYIQ